jgi:hypothetical protein
MNSPDIGQKPNRCWCVLANQRMIEFNHVGVSEGSFDGPGATAVMNSTASILSMVCEAIQTAP